MSINVNSLVPPPPGVPSTIVVEPFVEKFNESYADRAHAIADGILAGEHDVVVLNEVFSEEAREILVGRLDSEYPHYISKIGGVAPGDPASVHPPWLPELPIDEYIVDPLDSGLMIFSRFPFVSLSDPPNDADCSDDFCTFEGRNGLLGEVQGNDFAFATYEQCADLDCLASKGIALVRIDTAPRDTWVAFTHMQADVAGREPYEEERRSQYATIRDLMTTVIGESELGTDPVVLVGDLNTPGASEEWQETYVPGASPSFLACGNLPTCMFPTVLTDAFGFETSPDDLGWSQGTNRLDYVVHNSARGAWCMQHPMLAWEAAEGGVDWHSDHRAVRGDLNASAPFCSPNIAAANPDQRPRELVFGPESCDDDPNTPAEPCHQDEVITPDDGARITFPGSFQWFRISQEGSFVFSTLDAHPEIDVRYDVYDSSDLSRPLSPVDQDVPIGSLDGLAANGDQYLLPSPPYYIRTYAVRNGEPDRTEGNVPYLFVAHQNLCRSPQDACAIEPHIVKNYAWPDQSGALASVSDVWLKFRTSGVKDGALWPGPSTQPDPPRFPSEQFVQQLTPSSWGCLEPPAVEQYSTDGLFVLEEQPDWGEVQGGGPFDDVDEDGRLDGRYFAPELPGETFGEFKPYYLHLQRTCGEPVVSSVEQRTTLTYMEPETITGLLQFDDSGIGEDDLIRLLFTFDAEPAGSSPPCEGSCPAQGVFDEPDLAWQQADFMYLSGIPALRGYYVERFYPNVFEDENGPDASTRHRELHAKRGHTDLVAWRDGSPPARHPGRIGKDLRHRHPQPRLVRLLVRNRIQPTPPQKPTPLTGSWTSPRPGT